MEWCYDERWKTAHDKNTVQHGRTMYKKQVISRLVPKLVCMQNVTRFSNHEYVTVNKLFRFILSFRSFVRSSCTSAQTESAHPPKHARVAKDKRTTRTCTSSGLNVPRPPSSLTYAVYSQTATQTYSPGGALDTQWQQQASSSPTQQRSP